MQARIQDPDTDVSIEWLAGHFVGEGSITAAIQKSEPYGCGVPKVRLAVQVKVIEESECRAWRDYFGFGSVRAYDNSDWKPVYHWAVTGNRARMVLEHLQPYLHRGPKVDQCELALELLENYHRRGGGREISREEAERRIEIAEQIQALTQ